MLCYKRGRPPSWIEPTAHSKPVVPLGLMNNGTKEPTEKAVICRTSATPTVASFGKTKLNEMDRIQGRGAQKREQQG